MYNRYNRYREVKGIETYLNNKVSHVHLMFYINGVMRFLVWNT